MMLVVDRKADLRVMSAGGQADQGTAAMPPADSVATTPVAMMVIPMAITMETKSMYPRMANSEKLGGTASAKRMMAEIAAQTSAQIVGSSTIRINAMVPVRVCDPTRRMRNSANMTPVNS
jgi:hypothetical protein